MIEAVWTFAVPIAWMAAFLVFRRLRLKTKGFAERGVLRKRLPRWVTQVEMYVWIVLWVPMLLGWILAFEALHGSLLAQPREPGELATVLICLAAAIGTLPPAMLLANLISWIIPPLRRANLVAMEGLPTTSFHRATRGLAVFWVVVLPLSLAQSFLGAFEPWAS
jgi:hypothetical protein